MEKKTIVTISQEVIHRLDGDIKNYKLTLKYMILGFSTQIYKKPTYFVERILKGLIDSGFYESMHNELKEFIDTNAKREIIFYHRMWERIMEQNPKIHTIREDKTDRWKAGMKIDFFINVRTKKMFRFAPVLPVVSIQEIEIVYYHTKETIMNAGSLKIAVRVGKKQLDTDEMKALAINDGFDSLEEFFQYFNDDFTGKLIHWTDKKY
ncbi:hypothetical protein [Flavobacterium hydrophilum]|uniref:hypothetical protein n=1 Tax=Flavobacterium hydrophilum TaxID=2211445 RepID=UPI000F4E0341|nr:hypothetical protein [Flavobacterium hydrophilum]